ncbi:MAG: DUF11 domain-containing protein, partial [Dehalococcoidia bacterium]|nr:DUF11 domain-containing protein [Dehalococcoidia bacterium]
FTETVPGGWTLTSVNCTGGACTNITDGVTINLASGDDVICTFNNTQLGSITIEKQTLPDGGTGFGFTSNIEAPNSFSLNDDQTMTFTNVLPGTYTITESSLPTDWDLTNISCSGSADVKIGTDSDFDLGDTGVTIDLGPGESATCTFTNEERAVPQAIISITKTVTPTNAAPGDTVEYTIEYGNLDLATLNNVVIVDDYDQTYIASIADFQETTSTGPPIFGTSPDDNGSQLRWPSLTGTVTLPAGASGSLTYKATLKGPSAFPPAGSTNIDNTATIYSDDTEPLSDDARVTVTTGPVVVGGTVVRVDKAAILAPWIALFVAIVVSVASLTRRRKQGIWIG